MRDLSDILEKLTFRFAIGQLLPGALLVLTLYVAVGLQSGIPLSGIAALGDAYLAAIAGISNLGGVVVFTAQAAVVGLILQGASTLAAANLESFRRIELDHKGSWVSRPQEKWRPRSRVRTCVAALWSESPVILILFVAPLVLAFDLVSILAASPKRLYKDIYLIRSQSADTDLLTFALSDYQYMAEYCANMATALLVCTIWMIWLSPAFEHSASIAALIALAYVSISFHYLLYRAIKTAIDQAVFRTITKDTQARLGAPATTPIENWRQTIDGS